MGDRAEVAHVGPVFEGGRRSDSGAGTDEGDLSSALAMRCLVPQ